MNLFMNVNRNLPMIRQYYFSIRSSFPKRTAAAHPSSANQVLLFSPILQITYGGLLPLRHLQVDLQATIGRLSQEVGVSPALVFFGSLLFDPETILQHYC